MEQQVQTIQVFVYRGGVRDPQAVTVPPGATPGTIREALGSAAAPPDAHVWREGADAPLAEDAPAVSGNAEVLHVSRCQRIVTVVNYLKASQTKDFSPSVTLRAVLEWAEDTFHIEGAERPILGLAVCGQPKDLPSLRTHLGSLAVDCNACFDLVPVRKTEG